MSSNASAWACGAWEAVEDEALGIQVRLHLVADHADHDGIGHQFALVHQFLGLHTQWALGLDLGTQQITGAQVDQAVVLDQEIALRALAGPRRAEENDVQFAHVSCLMIR